jgi:hypothetical protein
MIETKLCRDRDNILTCPKSIDPCPDICRATVCRDPEEKRCQIAKVLHGGKTIVVIFVIPSHDKDSFPFYFPLDFLGQNAT